MREVLAGAVRKIARAKSNSHIVIVLKDTQTKQRLKRYDPHVCGSYQYIVHQLLYYEANSDIINTNPAKKQKLKKPINMLVMTCCRFMVCQTSN